jgi:CHAT domain-containing protein
LPRTRLVVLAACRTAAGVVSRSEGALSLARPFLAAGVPNVIASLWDVDDALSRRFFVALHRALLADGEPLSALRRVQTAFLRDADPTLAHPRLGAFLTWAASTHGCRGTRLKPSQLRMNVFPPPGATHL